MNESKFKPWETLSLGLLVSMIVPLIVVVFTQDYVWGLISLLLAVAFIFLKGLKKIEIGFLGVPLLFSRRLGGSKTKETDGEKIPIAFGPTLTEGWHWLLPLVMSSVPIDARLRTEKVEELPVYAKDGISVKVEASVTYLIKNPHQAFSVKGDQQISEGINELMEAAIRDVVKQVDSIDITRNSEHKTTLKEKILEATRGAEDIFGVDIIQAFIGDVELPDKMNKALELIKQNELYAEARKKLEVAGVPKDKLEEVSELNLGIATKEIKELKFDFGETSAGVLAKLLGLIIHKN